MYEINPDTGVLTSLGSPVPAGGLPTAIAVHPNRRWLYVTNKVTDNVFRYDIDATTGRLSLPADYSVAARYGPNSIAVHPNGRWAYVTPSTSDVPGSVTDNVLMYAIDAATGKLTALGKEAPKGVGLPRWWPPMAAGPM